jgi:ATP-dependent helicase/nuclease subunit A
MATGLVIHAALEFWNGEEPTELDSAATELARIEADRLGVEHESLHSEITELLAGFHGSELGAGFADREIVARELALLLRDEDGTRWRGSIDLVYRDGTAYVIADYKTDRASDETELQERYAGQLSVYARALRSALDLTELPRMELWMLRHGRRIVVPPIDPMPRKPEPTKRPAPGKRNKPGQQSLF